jgi:hypothetical protein
LDEVTDVQIYPIIELEKQTGCSESAHYSFRRPRSRSKNAAVPVGSRLEIEAELLILAMVADGRDFADVATCGALYWIVVPVDGSEVYALRYWSKERNIRDSGGWRRESAEARSSEGNSHDRKSNGKRPSCC